MVQVSKRRSTPQKFRSTTKRITQCLLIITFIPCLLCLFLLFGVDYSQTSGTETDNGSHNNMQLDHHDQPIPIHPIDKHNDKHNSKEVSANTSNDNSNRSSRNIQQTNDKSQIQCKYKTLNDLEPYERYPSANSTHRPHIIDPPPDTIQTNLTLVCCQTTAGPLAITAHSSWAPHGSSRFLQMVRQQSYFSSRIPLFRCLTKFLCQFGIAGDPVINRQYNRNLLADDVNWLPEGPAHRFDAHRPHVKRFAKGYLAYAGSGPHSRSNQLIVALSHNGPLGGGSPWEVPWGEVVGEDSFRTLDGIYTGYGENGPSQGRLAREGMSTAVMEEFPKMDYITSCTVLDEWIGIGSSSL